MANMYTLAADGSLTAIQMDKFDIRRFESYGIPILYLSGDIAGINKDDAVTLNYIYNDRSGTCTLKWQGSSSLWMPKKNFTIKFDTVFEVVSGWGAQQKYCLKANFVDPTHARNLISTKLWGQLVKSRTTPNASLSALPNGGAVDGFPIILALNGAFYGLYTWNIPKDGWMLGMSGTDQQQAILCAELNNNGAVAFRGLATLEEDANGELDFDLEYSSDDQSAWVLESVNRLIGAVKDSDGSNITKDITPYIDWDSAIDYYIHAVLTSNYDGILRNYLLSTLDGSKWFFTAYDIDCSYGLRAVGRYFYPASMGVSFEGIASMHKLFELVWTYMRPKLRARYKALRANILSVDNVANEITNFACGIPRPVSIADQERWPTIPSTTASTTDQMISYYRTLVELADTWIENTTGEQEMPSQGGYTNLVPTSIDTDGSILNGVGYVGGKRLSSSGVLKDATAYVVTTGFMPASASAVVRIAGDKWIGSPASSAYVCAYKSDFSFISAVNNEGSYGGGTVTGDSNLAVVTLLDNADIAWIRVSCGGYTDAPEASIIGARLIVTVNEEITD